MRKKKTGELRCASPRPIGQTVVMRPGHHDLALIINHRPSDYISLSPVRTLIQSNDKALGNHMAAFCWSVFFIS